jgi:hypothetical protein
MSDIHVSAPDAADETTKVHDEPDKESNLVKHARRELGIIGEDQDTIEGIVKIMQAFSDMGHSGGSASIVIPMVHELLQFHNLSPITNDPDEWMHHGEDVWGEHGGIWQNIRNGELFSGDGGKTYWSLADGSQSGNIKKIYVAKLSLK